MDKQKVALPTDLLDLNFVGEHNTFTLTQNGAEKRYMCRILMSIEYYCHYSIVLCNVFLNCRCLL